MSTPPDEAVADQISIVDDETAIIPVVTTPPAPSRCAAAAVLPRRAA